MKNRRVLIVTGGTISIEFAKEYLKDQKFNKVIAVDSGLTATLELNLCIDYMVGDFDSVPKEVLDIYQKKLNDEGSIVVKRYNPEKDKTDTAIALELAIQLDASEIILLGATGTRLDHMLANIQLLSITLEYNIKTYIIDQYNKLYLLDQNTTLHKDALYGPYLSILPYTEVVKDVTLNGFKYPLMKTDLHIGASLGISNEVTAEQAEIMFQSGILIITESKD